MKNFRKIFIQLLFLSLIFATFSSTKENLSTIELINKAKISDETKLLYKIYTIYSFDKLPKKFRSDVPIKCGTPILKEIKEDLKRIKIRNKSKFPEFIIKGRLPSPAFYGLDKIHQTVNFEIYYTLSGTHAVSPIDNNQNGVPDYIDDVASYSEESYNHQVNILGYLSPPKTKFKKYRIFVKRTIPFYGWITFDGEDTLIAVDSSMTWVPDNDDPEGKVKGALKVTIAHELFHAVKASYNWYIDYPVYWFDEATSVWIEEEIYPQVNDYIGYIKDYFNNPEESLVPTSYWDSYSRCVFAIYLIKKFDKDIIREIWERSVGKTESLPYVIAEINERSGNNFSGVFQDFTIANYLKDRNYYGDDAAKFPDVVIYQKQSLQKDKILKLKNGLDYLGTHYIKFASDVTYNVGVTFDGDNKIPWRFAILKKNIGYEKSIIELDITDKIGSAKMLNLDKNNYAVSVINNLSTTYSYPLKNYLFYSGINVDPTILPVEVKIVERFSGIIRLAWDSVADADEYKIYRSILISSKSYIYNLIGTTNLTNYEDKNVIDGVTYSYIVNAVFGDKESKILEYTKVPPLDKDKKDKVAISHVINYPNPYNYKADLNFKVEFKGGVPYKIYLELFNLSGRYISKAQVDNFRIILSNLTFSINRNHLPLLSNGVYLYRVIVYSSAGIVSRTGKLAILR